MPVCELLSFLGSVAYCLLNETSMLPPAGTIVDLLVGNTPGTDGGPRETTVIETRSPDFLLETKTCGSANFAADCLVLPDQIDDVFVGGGRDVRVVDFQEEIAFFEASHIGDATGIDIVEVLQRRTLLRRCQFHQRGRGFRAAQDETEPFAAPVEHDRSRFGGHASISGNKRRKSLVLASNWGRKQLICSASEC